jgi:hypothetical protein
MMNSEKTVARVEYVVQQVLDKERVLGYESLSDVDNMLHIGFALSNGLGEQGRGYFHQVNSVRKDYDKSRSDEMYNDCLETRNPNGKITISPFFDLAEDAGLKVTLPGTESCRVKPVELLNRKIDSASHNILPDNLQRIIKEIACVQNEADRSLFINKLHEKTGVTKNAIKKDMGVYCSDSIDTPKESKGKDIICAKFTGLVDVVLNDSRGTAFLIKDKNGELNLASKWDNSNSGFYVPPKKAELPFELPLAENVMECYKNEDHTLFEDLKTYFKRFSYLPDEQWLVLIMSVFLSYIQDHDDIHYLPYILFFAVPERGKSKTGKAMTYVCYRGIHVVELREANLFRYARDIGATLFFDIMNLWKKAVDNKVEDILLLRYERGARVSRVLYPEKGAFKDMEHYDVFGSTIFATNEAVDKILDTRCIPINMPNKPGRYEDPEPDKAQKLKERLTAWRASVFDKPLPEIEIVPELNGRLWDISRPMLQVCRLVYPEGVQFLEEVLINISAQKKEEKGAYIEGQIVNVLAELSPIKDEGITEWNIMTSEVLSKLNEDRPEERKLTAQYLGKKLKAIGINKRKINGRSELILNRNDFVTLLEQYGIDSLPNSTTCYSGSESNGESVESQANVDLFKLL